jgi:hypothetical protein
MTQRGGGLTWATVEEAGHMVSLMLALRSIILTVTFNIGALRQTSSGSSDAHSLFE